jgi:hypothetical protein
MATDQLTQARTLVRQLSPHEKLYHLNDLTMHVGIPLPELTAAVRQFEVRFRMAEDGPLVTAQLLALLEQGYSTQVHDTNIVETMQAVGVRCIPVLKARMNADLHMADDLKNTGKGNLFVIFGEPDIDILPVEGGKIQVKINGVDVFHPQTGEVRSDGAEGIAC